MTVPLELIIGPANSAKAGVVLGAYAAQAPRGALLIVPTAGDAAAYTRELAEQGVVLGASALTFAGLIDEIARRAGYEPRPLSALQREHLLRRAVNATRLRALGESAASAGFVSAAGAFFAELGRSLVTPQRFARALSQWRDEDPFAHDLASLYLAYAAELDCVGRPDRELHARRALDALRAAPQRWGAAPAFFYGFDDLTPLERDAIETLSRVAGARTTVSLTYEAGRRALAARAEAVEELRPLADRVQELPALDEHYAPGSREALHALERRLFDDAGGECVDPGEAIALLEAGGERAEAELVAAEVLALLRAAVPMAEIALVHRSPALAAPALQRVFAEYGIPLAAETPLPFSHSGLGRGLLALARCALAPGAPAEELLVYLRTPGVLEHPEVADRLEAEVRCHGLRTAAQARERIGWREDELRGAPDLLRHARRLLAAPRRGQAAVLEGPPAEDARALAALERAVGELSEVGEEPVGTELLELLERLEVPGARRAGIVLTDPLAIRARRFRVVFVCGLQEGSFPLAGAPEPFLSDELRRELAAASGLRLRSHEDALARERYLFYACTSRATERVVLSYRSSDEEGNVELPSPFLADVAEVLVEDWRQRRRRRLLADVVWAPEAAPTARELERARAAASAPAAGEPPAPPRMLSEDALARIRHREIVSAGALENYAACPVKWLVERELNPRRLEPDSDPMARGNCMHAVLEELLRRLGRPLDEASLPEARALLGELLAEHAADIAPGRPAPLRSAVIRGIEADLERYLAFEASRGEEAFEPRELELRFGFEDSELPPLELGHEVRLRGVIDRLDVDRATGTRAIVRDYKSGSARAEHQVGRWERDRQLQVALYMLAARELLGLEPVAGLYQHLSGEDLRPRGLFLDAAPYAGDARDRTGLEAELAGAAERAVAVALRLRAGELEPCPETCSRHGCAYPGICRSGA